jgi:hypothetical protein
MMPDELPPINGSVLSGGDMLALLTRIDDMLGKMEGRIMERLSVNFAAEADRWRRHDEELTKNTKRVVDRFEVIEAELLTVSNCLKAHLEKEHDEQVRTDARVKPVRTVALIVVQNWKSIALLILALLGILGWAGLETHIAGQ